MDAVYEYYEHDGAFFRKRADSGLPCVDEVYWPTVGWVRYTLDGVHRYMTSSRVNEADALRECAAQDEDEKRRAADAIERALRAIGGHPKPIEPVRRLAKDDPNRRITVIAGGSIMHLTPSEYDAWNAEQRAAFNARYPNAPKPKPTMTKQADDEGGVIIFGLPPKSKTR